MKYAIITILLSVTYVTLSNNNHISFLYFADLPEVVVKAPIISQYDIEICARLVAAEAGNEPYEGQLAVLDVVINRLTTRKKYKSISDVIFAPGQFDGVYNKSWYHPRKEHYKVARDKLLHNKNILDKSYYYFHNPITSTDIRHIREVEKHGFIDIGNHRFCKQRVMY